jgi:RNA polymerase sigma factor for flagellar operon FliA
MNVQAAYMVHRQLDPEQLVYAYAPLVKRIAHHLAGRLPASVQIDDLIQVGMIGLLDAARNFSDAFGAAFATYASTRIRGAMLDEVRRMDWVPRSVHRKARQAAEAIRLIENREGREARDAEIAQALNLSLEEYREIAADAVGCKLVSIDEVAELAGEEPETGPDRTGAEQGPARELEEDRFRQDLVQAIEGLPDREKLVMSLYYDEELNLREIGRVLGVSESRVCQIHGQALMRLRARLHDWLDRSGG